MQYLSNEWLGLALLAWAVLSVIWLTLAVGSARQSREDADAQAKLAHYRWVQTLQREDRIAELVSEIREKDVLLSHLSFELDRIYVSDTAAVPARTESNVDKVLAYYQS